MFPNRTLGEASGQVDLVKVPNTNQDWSFSLTPHKVCDRFDKKQGKAERNAFQEKVAQKVIDRFKANGEMPGFHWNWTDIIGLQQMCGEASLLAFLLCLLCPSDHGYGTLRLNRLRDCHPRII